MPLETANTIFDLNPNWPTGSDGPSEGDNHLRMIKAVLQAAYPVGATLINTTGTSPSTYIGGTWAQIGQGRALVGVGDNGESSWAAGEERGSEVHVLTEDELPAHSHTVDPIEATTSEDPGHTHGYQDAGRSSALGRIDSASYPFATTNQTSTTTATGGVHTHTVSVPEGATSAVGADVGHNNVQPSLAVFVWERTA